SGNETAPPPVRRMWASLSASTLLRASLLASGRPKGKTDGIGPVRSTIPSLGSMGPAASSVERVIHNRRTLSTAPHRATARLEFVCGTHQAKLDGHNGTTMPCPRAERGQGSRGSQPCPGEPNVSTGLPKSHHVPACRDTLNP